MSVLAEPQSTQTSANEQENAGMLLLQEHQVLGFSKLGNYYFVSLVLAEENLGSSTLFSHALKRGKV